MCATGVRSAARGYHETLLYSDMSGAGTPGWRYICRRDRHGWWVDQRRGRIGYRFVVRVVCRVVGWCHRGVVGEFIGQWWTRPPSAGDGILDVADEAFGAEIQCPGLRVGGAAAGWEVGDGDREVCHPEVGCAAFK
jgi:hypothetical protein